jgi:hypothetical protein
VTDYSPFIRKLELPAGYAAPAELVYENLVAQALTRDHLADDVRGINASIELIRSTTATARTSAAPTCTRWGGARRSPGRCSETTWTSAGG